MDLSAKQSRLEESLLSLGRTLVAYSGGVDSAYLAWAAHRVLGQEMLAVIADSPSLARTQLRCFHCKDELFQKMVEFAGQRGFHSIAYGVNVDDQGDFRPGQSAARQHHV